MTTYLFKMVCKSRYDIFQPNSSDFFFLLLHENICCGYSLEAPQQGASNEYPQHMFVLKKIWKKIVNTFSCLELEVDGFFFFVFK